MAIGQPYTGDIELNNREEVPATAAYEAAEQEATDEEVAAVADVEDDVDEEDDADGGGDVDD